ELQVREVLTWHEISDFGQKVVHLADVLFQKLEEPPIDCCPIGVSLGSSLHSAASSRPAIRRLWRACSLYSSCQSVGPLEGLTCTAVTLYSGQFVAQSEYSVVTTLACVFGWWNVV